MAYKIKSGWTQNLADTKAFIELLNRLPGNSSDRLSGFFSDASEVTVSRAPARLDVMGGVADYSGSLVLQFPVANATHVAVQLQREQTLSIISFYDNRSSVFEMPLSDFSHRGKVVEYAIARGQFSREPESHWAAYVAGAFLVLKREKASSFDKGARIFINSSVPVGSGVSSSASLEVSAMQAITAAYSIELSHLELARFCQMVENLVAGAPCGIMDQMAVVFGCQGHLMKLLCQPDDLKGNLKLPEELQLWGIDSGICHSVSNAEYGTVRTAAFMGYRMIADIAGLTCKETGESGHVQIVDPDWNGYLANITTDQFEAEYAPRLPLQLSGGEFLSRYQGTTDPVTTVDPDRIYPVRQATRHPIHEHARVSRFANILEDWKDVKEVETLGDLMYESHASYSACRLGSAGTDDIVNCVRVAGVSSGLYGARITGGGSGGTVAVLGHKTAENSIEKIVRDYAGRTRRDARVISGSSPGAGAFGHLQLARE